MKLSTLSIIGIALVSSKAVSGNNDKDDETACLNSISEAQECLKRCGDVEVSDSNSTTFSSNLLMECISLNEFNDLGSCCEMDDECADTWSTSSSCMTNTLTNIMDKSIEYIQCIREPGVCTGGVTDACMTSLKSMFQGGGNADIADMAGSATTCSDMDPFLTDTCTTAEGCCSACSPLIAGVVEAVTNDLILPVYNRMDPILNCPGMTCGGDDGIVTPPATTTASGDDDEGVDLATECNTVLAQNIVLHNESYAVEDFFRCITKTTGKIMLEADDAKGGGEVEDEKSSTSSSPFLFFGSMTSFVSISIIASSSIIITFIIA